MKNYRKNFKSYFSDLAKLKPSPGGGSAICLSFCLSVALIEKAVNYSISTRLKTAKDKAKNKRLKSGLKILAGLRTKIYPYIDKDAVIFKKIMSSYGA